MPNWSAGDTALCLFSVLPLRRRADVWSEMVSQIRLGETAEVLEECPGFLRLRCHADGYEGWADARQFCKTAEEVTALSRFITDSLAGEAVSAESESALLLPLGTPLPGWDGACFHLNGEAWRWSGAVRETVRIPERGARGFAKPDGAAAVAYAARHLNTPYLWGGRTVFGIDCSGLLQAVWAAQGFSLPRDSMEQAPAGVALKEFSEIHAGDAAFFCAAEGAGGNMKAQRGVVTHTGICTGDGSIIHASGRVRRDPLTPEGVVDFETGRLTHRLLGLRRISGETGDSGFRVAAGNPSAAATPRKIFQASGLDLRRPD